MITETKRPSLIPKPGQTLEQAREAHFGAKWPPKTVGDLPGYNPSAKAVQESLVQAENVKSTRRLELGWLRKVRNYGAVIVAAAGIAAGTTELAHLMGNEEHAPWDKPIPAHVNHR